MQLPQSPRGKLKMEYVDFLPGYLEDNVEVITEIRFTYEKTNKVTP